MNAEKICIVADVTLLAIALQTLLLLHVSDARPRCDIMKTGGK
jgi:hypothetical protein